MKLFFSARYCWFLLVSVSNCWFLHCIVRFCWVSCRTRSVSSCLCCFDCIFSSFFLGLAFCGFLPESRFSVKACPDRVLQRRVRRFWFEMRKKTLLKRDANLRCGIQAMFLRIKKSALVDRWRSHASPLALRCRIERHVLITPACWRVNS